MSTNPCAPFVLSMLLAIEAGQEPSPIFFTGRNCSGDQWPRPGEVINPSMLNRDIGRSELCKDATTLNCPLPLFQSAILPSGFALKLKALSHPRVSRTGQINIVTSNTALPRPFTVRDNVLNISMTSKEPTMTWRRQSLDGDLENDGDCPLPIYTGPSQGGRDGSTWVWALTTCGAPVWPSFAPVSTDGSDNNLPVRSGANWSYRMPGPPFSDYCISHGGSLSVNSYGRGVYGWVPFGNANELRDSFAPKHSTVDCAPGLSGSDDDVLTCVPGQLTNSFRNCSDPGSQIRGSLQSMAILTDGIQGLDYFKYCIGYKGQKYTFGTIEVQRYQPGSPTCDLLVQQYCNNSAVVQSDPSIQYACSCVLESQRLQEQFEGIDLPVSCFSQICNASDPAVYKTAKQQTGCSARICQQTINVNGDGILAQGYQSLECNGIIYRLDGNGVGESPNVSLPEVDFDVADSPSFSPTTEFYIAIGLVVIMFLLVIVWVITRVVQYRRQKAEEEENDFNE